MASSGNATAWVTLATTDSYALGALVLAHSLRQVETAHQLVILITPGVTAAMRHQLESAFDRVEVVDVLDSGDAAHLALLARPELGVTLTKLHCWTLTEYSRAVFLDADCLVMSNCDELLQREELSAAPDVGWPDCFNSGVFVFTPSLETFRALLQMATDQGSFDGGDQGLLNQYFSDWATADIRRHLPFVYNMTASATYTYLPAFRRFGKDVKIVHFLGAVKPWHGPQQADASSPSGALHAAWWQTYRERVLPAARARAAGDGRQAAPPADQHRLAEDAEQPQVESQHCADTAPLSPPPPPPPPPPPCVEVSIIPHVSMEHNALMHFKGVLSEVSWDAPLHDSDASSYVPPSCSDTSSYVQVASACSYYTDSWEAVSAPESPPAFPGTPDHWTTTPEAADAAHQDGGEPESGFVDASDSLASPQSDCDGLGDEAAVGATGAGDPQRWADAAVELSEASRRRWEAGQADYIGRDRFDNVWRRIEATLSSGEERPQWTPSAPAAAAADGWCGASPSSSSPSSLQSPEHAGSPVASAQKRAAPPPAAPAWARTADADGTLSADPTTNELVAEMSRLEVHCADVSRRAAWERGQMDFMGSDSFDNILSRINKTLSE